MTPTIKTWIIRGNLADTRKPAAYYGIDVHTSLIINNRNCREQLTWYCCNRNGMPGEDKSCFQRCLKICQLNYTYPKLNCSTLMKPDILIDWKVIPLYQQACLLLLFWVYHTCNFTWSFEENLDSNICNICDRYKLFSVRSRDMRQIFYWCHGLELSCGCFHRIAIDIEKVSVKRTLGQDHLTFPQ